MTPFEVVILIVILGLLFDYTNGFHDAANVVSTVIATKALAPLAAITLAAVLNFLGSTQTGRVVQTITSGLVLFDSISQLTILCALLGAIFWNLVTWYFGIPSSSSYALVGGLVGASWVQVGKQIILWNGVIKKVIIPMVISPIVGFMIAFLFMKVLFWLLHHPKMKKYESLFPHLQVGSASLVALAHGCNDAQKSMGIITLGLLSVGILSAPIVPFWVILSCALMMGLGTATGGFRIIKTVGYDITHLEPVQGFAAECSASFIIFLASFMGMPISSTHMIVGCVTGVGSSKGLKKVSWVIAKKMILTWILTLPGAGLVAALLGYLIA